MKPRQAMAAAVLLAGAVLCGGAAWSAEAYPARPIQVIIPYPPGGALDIGMRIIQPQLSANLGVPLVVMNRPGASGVLGMGVLANAAADGYTVGATSTSTLTVVQIGTPNLPYKLSDFIPIGNYAVDLSVLFVAADARWKTFDDLVAEARRSPGKLTYGSPGIGTLSSLNIGAVRDALGLDLVEVPYPATPQVNLAVQGKQIDVGSAAFSGIGSAVKDGSIRVLTVGGSKRLPSVPDAPSLTEKGLPDGGLNLALGLYVPAGTPQPIVEVLSAALRKTMSNPEVVAAIEKTGMFVQVEDGATVQNKLESEYRNVMGLGRRLNLIK
jgi:tripartite-type tricarboxylate transporter receptor subunit TctC